MVKLCYIIPDDNGTMHACIVQQWYYDPVIELSMQQTQQSEIKSFSEN